MALYRVDVADRTTGAESSLVFDAADSDAAVAQANRRVWLVRAVRDWAGPVERQDGSTSDERGYLN